VSAVAELTLGLRRSREALPLAAWVAIGVAAASGVALLTVGLVLKLSGGVDDAAEQALGAGIGVALIVAVIGGVAAARYAAAITAIRQEAVRRLQDPTARDAAVALPTRASGELRELVRTLDALHLRVRVADEVASRHRRSAETASAGMFELLSGLVAAEEATRGQLAAELHDTVAQSLMLARSMLEAPEHDPDQVDRAAELVQEAEEQVRAVMARTRPPALREGDLARAVEGLRDELHQRYGLVVHLRWPPSPYPLALASAVAVYRFFQEALLNVVKHADVDAAEASLVVDEDGLVATVSDHGPGFDPDEVRADRGRHVGLGLLRERARLASGSLVVSSWPGDGTTLTLRLPRGPGGVIEPQQALAG
jgi:signal transduction histidine kinase